MVFSKKCGSSSMTCFCGATSSEEFPYFHGAKPFCGCRSCFFRGICWCCCGLLLTQSLLLLRKLRLQESAPLLLFPKILSWALVLLGPMVKFSVLLLRLLGDLLLRSKPMDWSLVLLVLLLVLI